MAIFGLELIEDSLVLTEGRDFRWGFDNLGDDDEPEDFPDGELYFELYHTDPPTVWEFTITGPSAELKVESSAVDLVPSRTRWQLVWLPDGEAAGGEPLARGRVVVQK